MQEVKMNRRKLNGKALVIELAQPEKKKNKPERNIICFPGFESVMQ